MDSWVDVGALTKIVLVGLLAGAGLPALFALGLRGLDEPEDGSTRVLARAGGVLAMLLVLGGIAWGLYLVVVT